MSLVMSSPAKGQKKATVVVCEGASFEDINLRERHQGEPVHLRDTQHEPCVVCGHVGGVWVENASSHRFHNARCSEHDTD